jgi:hypothetical protein
MEIRNAVIMSNIARCTLAVTTGNFVHRIQYEANTTDPKKVKVLAFSDEVTLIEQDVVRGVLGTITLDHGAPCTTMPLTEMAMQSIAEFNQLIKLIESGEVNGKANV